MKRILVVDDSAFIGIALGTALRAAGFFVDTARDLAEIERAARPDLVLMDIVLPEAFGDDIAAQLRATGKLACPIVLMSSLPEGELAQRARETGVEGFVSKQRGLAAIVSRVRAVLGLTAPAPAPRTSSIGFDVLARQRMRRVRHVAADSAHWNGVAVLIELDALAGDADLLGARGLGDAARRARDLVAALEDNTGPTPEVESALRELALLVGATHARAAVLLVDATDGSRDALLEPLDRAGCVVIEARGIAEARQLFASMEPRLVVASSAFDPAFLEEVPADRRLVLAAGELAPERVLAVLGYR